MTYDCIESRIAELAALKDGWLDGAGTAYNLEQLQWFEAIITKAISAGMPVPHIFPSESGDVVCEWGIMREEISAWFDVKAHTVEIINTTKEPLGCFVDLKDHDGIIRLVDSVRGKE